MISRKVLVGSLLCLGVIAVALWARAGRGKVHYLLYYLPCPEIFPMKLQYTEEKLIQLFPQLFYQQPRVLVPKCQDVLTVTPWLAPIVWEGTFDPQILDSAYRPLNLTTGVTSKQGKHPVGTVLGVMPFLCGKMILAFLILKFAPIYRGVCGHVVCL